MVYWLGFGAFMAVVKAVRSHKSCSAAKKKKERQKGKFTNLNTKLVDVLKGNGTFGLYFLLNKKNLQLLDHCLLYNVKNLCP